MLPRLGAVSYLNTKPLVHGMTAASDAFELIYDLPSRLADRLANRELTAALIPSIEANSPDYTIVSDACIGCRGPVWSVKLISRVPPRQIRTLALDEGSRTSCVLAQIILAQKYSVHPAMRPLKMTEDWCTVDTDAVLIIGDRAMNVDDNGFEFSWDLGEAWFDMTGLPFVFAVWAARDAAHFDDLNRILSASRDCGLDQLEQIANENAEKYGLTKEDCLRYLGQHLHFELGFEEKAGMELFFRYAAEMDLITAENFRFYDCGVHEQ